MVLRSTVQRAEIVLQARQDLDRTEEGVITAHRARQFETMVLQSRLRRVEIVRQDLDQVEEDGIIEKTLQVYPGLVV